jgi:hypothetical protein
MKNLLLATLFIFTALSGCKDDTPVDGTNNTTVDPIETFLGKYTCDYKLFNALTGVESDKGSFECEIWKNVDDDTKFDFRIDGLALLMTGASIKTVGDGYTFSIPEQTVKNFGDLIGKAIINIDGQTAKVEGHYITASNNIICYCERARKVGQDNDLFEFQFVKK